MKRRGLAVLLAAVLGASMLAGCGNSEDGSSGGKKKSPSDGLVPIGGSVKGQWRMASDDV